MEQPDYQAYLASVYRNTTWTLSALSGGMVNTTMRATRTSQNAGPDDAPLSLILKHARPYVQSAGPEFAFSIQRQVNQITFSRVRPNLTRHRPSKLPCWS